MVICGLLIFVLLHLEGKERSLNGLRELASDPKLVQAAAEKLVEMGSVPARFGNHVLGLHEKERSGIMSTVARHLSFLIPNWSPMRSPKAALTRVSCARPKAREQHSTSAFLRTSWKPKRGLLGCWISTLIRVIGTTGDENNAEVLTLIDEASALGSLSALEEALVRGRSAGVRLLLAYQSDSQVRIAFRDKPTLIYDNSDAQLYLGGANSFETAELHQQDAG